MNIETKVVNNNIEWRKPSSKEKSKELFGLVDYLYISPFMMKFLRDYESFPIMGTKTTRKDMEIFIYTNNILSQDFPALISLLSKITRQKGTLENVDGGDKLTFQFVGIFCGIPFTLYDYKGDKSIHIGAPLSMKNNTTWLISLKNTIVKELSQN